MPDILESSASDELIFKKKLKKLEQFRGRGTELISVYIPAQSDRSSVMGQLTEEISQSSNIKSPQTRKNVQGALRKITGFLKQIDFKIPKNGIVVFAGNISESEGRSDIRLFTVKPIKELRTKRYWCDSSFHLEPLKEMSKPSSVYGLITIDKNEATTAALIGKTYEILGHFTSGYSGKMRAGGQCLSPDTCVSLFDGQNVLASEVKRGDKVKGVNINTLKLINSEVLDKWETEKEEMLIISIKNPELSIQCSKDHLIFVWVNNTIQEKEAEKISDKDLLVFYSEKENKIIKTKISNIVSIKEKTKMVDLSVKEKNFIANGLIVHNSAQRFERLREEAEQEFYKRISEKANAAFLPYGDKLQGIIIGGPGMTKQFFIEKDMLDHRLKGKIIAVIDTGYTDESGIRELVQKSETALKDTDLMKEKNLMNNFLTQLAKDELAIYGEKEVMGALELGQVDKLLISEAIEWNVYKVKNTTTNEERIIIDKDNSFEENSFKGAEQIEVLEEYEFVDYMMEKAEKTSATLEIISTETPEGEQFYKGFGGIGAILRYKI